MKDTYSNFDKNDLCFQGLKIKLLGDSITHGVGGDGFCQNGAPIVGNFARNPDGFCWAKLIKEYLETKYGCQVTNNACTGTTIEFILKNFDALVSDEDDLILCTIGTNNRHQNKSTGQKQNREEFAEAFYRNILNLNERFTERNQKVIFVSNIPASEQNEKDGGDYWRILHMNDINDIYKRASASAGFPLISMYDAFTDYIKENRIELNSLLADGLHPNDDGYKVMFGLLCRELGI